MSLLPCDTCPWRTDKTAADIPRYVHRKACGLINTVGDGDAFRPIMACHYSTEEKMQACRGYLARAGWSNINVRLLLTENKILNPTDVLEECRIAGIRLHRTYAAVLKKLARTQPKAAAPDSPSPHPEPES